MGLDNDNSGVAAKARRGRPENLPANPALPDALRQDRPASAEGVLDGEREAFLHARPDLYVRLHEDGTVLGCRTSDEQNLSALLGQPVGKTLSALLPAPSAAQMADAIQHVLRTDLPSQLKYTLAGACGDRTFEAELLRFGENELIAIIREVSDRRRLEFQQGRLPRELPRAAGDQMKPDALLPICSRCKRIRDDQGTWQRLEKYLVEHSGLQFTHSLCPQCARELYPDVFPAHQCQAGQK